ncbi:MAG: histidine phosphatase family protein [Promethearchaeota archaeon]
MTISTGSLRRPGTKPTLGGESTITTIYFIRHGESEVNITKEFSYKLVDKPLTAKGRLQAQQAGEYFSGISLDAIYSSPLIRAQETAHFISTLHPQSTLHSQSTILSVRVLEQFRELNVGDLEKTPPTEATWDRFFETWNSWSAGDYDASFPNGENYHQLLARMQDGLRIILSNPNITSALVAGHGGIFMRTLPSILTNLSFKDLENQYWPNTGITVASFRLEGNCPIGEILKYGQVTHLHGEAAEQTIGIPDSVSLSPK